MKSCVSFWNPLKRLFTVDSHWNPLSRFSTPLLKMFCISEFLCLFCILLSSISHSGNLISTIPFLVLLVFFFRACFAKKIWFYLWHFFIFRLIRSHVMDDKTTAIRVVAVAYFWSFCEISVHRDYVFSSFSFFFFFFLYLFFFLSFFAVSKSHVFEVDKIAILFLSTRQWTGKRSQRDEIRYKQPTLSPSRVFTPSLVFTPTLPPRKTC